MPAGDRRALAQLARGGADRTAGIGGIAGNGAAGEANGGIGAIADALRSL
ncbi:hypothetical protein [Streptomyces sp. NPDC002133]